jgi:hypothetical protein
MNHDSRCLRKRMREGDLRSALADKNSHFQIGNHNYGVFGYNSTGDKAEPIAYLSGTAIGQRDHE